MAKLKIVYFSDFTDIDTINQEFELIKNQLAVNDINLNNYEVNMAIAEFTPDPHDFDILFFDYGGISIGNSLLDDFCRKWITMAEDYPNKIFIMTSDFTALAMEDAMSFIENSIVGTETIGNKKFPNIFLNIDDSCTELKEILLPFKKD